MNKYELDRSVPIPLYYQLKSILLSEIENGNIAVGNCIPTEAELSDMCKISRSTVRQAISELVQEGWLERKTSKGTFVTKSQRTTSYIRSFEPFYQQATRLGKVPSTEVIELSIIDANEEIASNLQIPVGDKAIFMFRRRLADGVPMVTIANYLPYYLCSFILKHDFKNESLYEVLTQNPKSRCGCTKTIVSAAKATAKDVKLLGIKIGSPVLCFNTITHTPDEKIVDFAYSHYRGDLNRFEIDAYPKK